MENRKIIVGVAALAALLLLFAGVGYAVFSGNARTYNEGNSDTLAYMTATPDDFSAMANEASTIFDTYVYDKVFSAVANEDEDANDFASYYVFDNGKYVLASSILVPATYDANETYYTYDGAEYTEVATSDENDFATYYVLVGNEYVLASSTTVPDVYDANKDYYTMNASIFEAYAVAEYVQVINSVEDDLDNYFIYDNGAYVAATAPYDAGTTYYVHAESMDVYVVANLTVGDSAKGYYLIDNGAYTVQGEQAVVVADKTYYEKITYTSVFLGDKIIEIDNETDGDIKNVDLEIKAYNDSGVVGSADFVYVFKVQAADGLEQYVVFDGSDTTVTVEGLACAVNDGAQKDVTLSLYIGYVPNVYVPTNYVGGVSDVQQGSYTYPYITPAADPADLDDTDFAFRFTDATPESP